MFALFFGGVATAMADLLSADNPIAQAFTGLRPRGRLINTGFPDGPIALDAAASIFGQLEFRGSTQDHRRDLREVLDLAARGKVKPMIEVYPLVQANQARERLEAGKVRYRAVLQHA